MTDKFDGYTFEQLTAMLAGAKEGPLFHASETLKLVHEDIKGIGEEIKAHVAHVKWEGEAAHAFRTWGGQLVLQTTAMADYAKAAGDVMNVAGEGLTKGKSHMPDAVSKLCSTNPDTVELRTCSDKDKHTAAVQAMTTVDSYYTTAVTDLGKLKEPNFPPLPGRLSYGDEPEYEIPTGSSPAGSGGSGTGNAEVAGAPFASGADRITPGGVAHAGESGSNGQAHIPTSAEHAPGTRIDHTTTLPSPETTTTPPAPTPVPDSRVHPSGHAPLPVPSMPIPGVPSVPPARTLPNTGIPGRLPGEPMPPAPSTGSPGRVPTTRYPSGPGVVPVTPGRIPRVGMNDGVVGMPARPSNPSETPRLPRGTVVGEERSLGASRGPVAGGPMGMGGHGFGTGATGMPNGGSARRIATEPGGVVGSPRESGVNGQRLPKGTVAGEERNALARGPVGMGLTPVAGNERPSARNSEGRRLASEPGGDIARQQTRGTGRSEFTTGGSGLVREGQAAGSLRNRPRKQVNNEETGSGGQRHTVPPVVE